MRVLRWFVSWLVLVSCAEISMAIEPWQNAKRDFRVVGYLPDYRSFEATQAAHLTDLIVFSAQPTEQGEIDMGRLAKLDWAPLHAAKRDHKVRLHLCIGGWERSKHFGKVATSDELRKKFVKAALRVCQDKQLSGIDIDWEHPHDVNEQNAYATLLQDLHNTLQPAGLKVSMTLAAWQNVPPLAFESVDWIQVMAYDHPGRHSTFENAQADVNKLIKAGAQPHKITLGLPFYGRAVEKP